MRTRTCPSGPWGSARPAFLSATRTRSGDFSTADSHIPQVLRVHWSDDGGIKHRVSYEHLLALSHLKCVGYVRLSSMRFRFQYWMKVSGRLHAPTASPRVMSAEAGWTQIRCERGVEENWIPDYHLESAILSTSSQLIRH
jgi:hypothetical protein